MLKIQASTVYLKFPVKHSGPGDTGALAFLSSSLISSMIFLLCNMENITRCATHPIHQIAPFVPWFSAQSQARTRGSSREPEAAGRSGSAAPLLSSAYRNEMANVKSLQQSNKLLNWHCMLFFVI